MGAISSAYFYSVVTKIDQLLYDRSVVRVFVQLGLKSISCYMIDQLCVFLYSRGRLFNGLRYCHENCNSAIFLPIYVMLDGFKIVSAMCDKYPPFRHPDQSHSVISTPNEKRKKTDTDASGIFDKYSWGSKSALLLSRILFLEPKNKKLTSRSYNTWS